MVCDEPSHKWHYWHKQECQRTWQKTPQNRTHMGPQKARPTPYPHPHHVHCYQIASWHEMSKSSTNSHRVQTLGFQRNHGRGGQKERKERRDGEGKGKGREKGRRKRGLCKRGRQRMNREHEWCHYDIMVHQVLTVHHHKWTTHTHSHHQPQNPTNEIVWPLHTPWISSNDHPQLSWQISGSHYFPTGQRPQTHKQEGPRVVFRQWGYSPQVACTVSRLEHLWHYIKKRLAEYEEPANSVGELWDRVQKVWDEIPKEELLKPSMCKTRLRWRIPQ